MAKKKVTTVKTEKYEVDPEDQQVIVVEEPRSGPAGCYFTAGEYSKVVVRRISPRSYKGTPLQTGSIGTLYDEDVDDELIRTRFGGGKFQITAFDPERTNQYLGSKTLEIVGVPKEFEEDIDPPQRPQEPGFSSFRSEMMLRREIDELKREIREANRSGLGSLLDNPEGLAAIITAISPLVRRDEDPRLASLERQIERLIDGQRRETPDLETMMKIIAPIQDVTLGMVEKISEARIDAMVNSNSSNEWIAFAREVMHGPMGEKIGAALEGLKSIGEQRSAPTAPPQPTASPQELPGIAGEWFHIEFIPRLAHAIENDVTPEDFAVVSLQGELIKEPFLDYLFEDWSETGDAAEETNKILKQFGMPEEMYSAFQSPYVLEWIHKCLTAVYRLVEKMDEEIERRESEASLPEADPEVHQKEGDTPSESPSESLKAEETSEQEQTAA